MKKKIFLVSALVAIAMSAMFISCEKSGGNEPSQSKGCKCTYYWNGNVLDSEGYFWEDLDENIKSCSELEKYLARGLEDDEKDVKCKSF